MSAIIEARGPVIEALRRYDPGLRVRWSHEKKCWAVDAPFTHPNPNVIPKPIKFQRIGNGDYWIETLLPEYSERNIQYRDRRYVVCWAKRVTHRLLDAIVKRDGQRFKRGIVGVFDKNQADTAAGKRKEATFAKGERVYAAWDRFKFDRRKLGAGAEDGTGVSIKGMNMEAE